MVFALLVTALLVPLEPPPAPPRAESEIPEAFYRGVLSWDSSSNQVVRGRERAPLPRDDFFREVGRVDLVEKSHTLLVRRVALSIAAGATLVAGSVAAYLFFANAGDLNSRYCVANVRNYNEICVPHYKTYQIGGGAAVGVTLVTTALLATLAYWNDPAVVDADEATQLASHYNGNLLRRLRNQPGSLRWLPAITPQGAQLAVAGRF